MTLKQQKAIIKISFFALLFVLLIFVYYIVVDKHVIPTY